MIKLRGYVRSQVLMAANIQTTVSWNVMLCTSVGGYQYFTGIFATVLKVKRSDSTTLTISRKTSTFLQTFWTDLHTTWYHIPRGLWFCKTTCPSII